MPFPNPLCHGIRWGGVSDSGFSYSTLVKKVEIFSMDPSEDGDLCPLRAQDALMEESEQQSAVLQEIVSGADAVLNIDMSSIFRATCSHFDVEFVGWFIHSQIPLLLDFEMMFQQQFWKAETVGHWSELCKSLSLQCVIANSCEKGYSSYVVFIC